VTVPLAGSGGLEAALDAVVTGACRFVEQLGTAPCLAVAVAGDETRATFDLVWRDDVERDVLVTAVTTIALTVGADSVAVAVVGTMADRPVADRPANDRPANDRPAAGGRATERRGPDRIGGAVPVGESAVVGLTVTATGVVAQRMVPFSELVKGNGTPGHRAATTAGHPAATEHGRATEAAERSTEATESRRTAERLAPGQVRLGDDLDVVFLPLVDAFRPATAYVPLPAEVAAAYVNLRQAGCMVRTDGT